MRAHGLPLQSLQDVFRATVEAKLIYAAPAWSGFCSAADRVRLNAFLHRCAKLGYRDHAAPDISTLFTDCDEQFFKNIIYNSLHNLQQCIPDKNTVNCTLRTRSHNKALIPKTSELNERNFFSQKLVQKLLLICTWILTRCCYFCHVGPYVLRLTRSQLYILFLL